MDDLTILVVPQINPDRFSRPGGPMRGNLWGLDLNRDHMKPEQFEIQGFGQNSLHAWAPHFYLDGHNCGSPPGNIAHHCPSHAAGDQRITALCDSIIFPAIDAKLEADDYSSFHSDTGASEARWTTDGTHPRLGRDYGGTANTAGILFESPSGLRSLVDVVPRTKSLSSGPEKPRGS